MRRFSCVVVAFLSISTCAFATSLTAPGDIRQAVSSNGAVATIDMLKKNDSWKRLVEEIQDGKTAWLKVVPLLRPAADEAAADDLDKAVGQAIKRNPSTVLRMIGQGVSAENICKEPLEKTAASYQFRAETEKAVRRVRDHSLKEQREKCLRELYLGRGNMHAAAE
ncbi:hypothetical protein [Oryzifoliimicrobium ureilyticus]|uniref:hypothetical protein n=1 Tax=Oryzifoliimicrobium ureilyticus TaxID=3113724 RepID=UPI00307637EC